MKDAKRSQQIFDILKKETKPDESMYDALIQAYFNIREVEKAVDVCKQMLKQGIIPTIITLKTMVRGFAKNGFVEQAREMLNKFVQSGKADSLAFLYNVVIDGYFRVGQLEEAENLFHEMKSSSRVSPDTVTYNTMINGFALNRETKKARKYYLMMKKDGIYPDESTFKILQLHKLKITKSSKKTVEKSDRVITKK